MWVTCNVYYFWDTRTCQKSKRWIWWEIVDYKIWTLKQKITFQPNFHKIFTILVGIIFWQKLEFDAQCVWLPKVDHYKASFDMTRKDILNCEFFIRDILVFEWCMIANPRLSLSTIDPFGAQVSFQPTLPSRGERASTGIMLDLSWPFFKGPRNLCTKLITYFGVKSLLILLWKGLVRWRYSTNDVVKHKQFSS